MRDLAPGLDLNQQPSGKVYASNIKLVNLVQGVANGGVLKNALFKRYVHRVISRMINAFYAYR